MEYHPAIKKVKSCYLQGCGWHRGYYVKPNKSIRDRQLSYDLTHMWNLRNKTVDYRGREEKIKQDKIREGDKP